MNDIALIRRALETFSSAPEEFYRAQSDKLIDAGYALHRLEREFEVLKLEAGSKNPELAPEVRSELRAAVVAGSSPEPKSRPFVPTRDIEYEFEDTMRRRGVGEPELAVMLGQFDKLEQFFSTGHAPAERPRFLASLADA